MLKIFESVPEFSHPADEPPYDCNDGAFMKLYRSVSLEEYKAYTGELKAAGFTLFDENRIKDNYYSGFKGSGFLLHTDYSSADGCMHVIADPNTNLYEKEEAAFDKPADTVLYQFEIDHSLIDCGMCYIIQCADNSFFIVDSAHVCSVPDNQRIYDFLRKLTPEGKKIIISGWFFSHGHVDHIGKFMDFLKYNYNDDVVIEKLYYNFVSCSHPDNGEWMISDKIFQLQFEELVKNYPEIPGIKLHSGQTFWVRNLKFDVLCTHEDIYPDDLINYNDSSTVLMMTACGNKVLFPGDAGEKESRLLETCYGDYLKCDIVQVSHHGHFGTTVEFYELARADVALFATTQIMYDGDWPVYAANRKAVELSREHYIASNGTVKIKLPYKPGATEVFPDETFEDFDAIYNLWGYEYTEERKKELREAFEKRRKK